MSGILSWIRDFLTSPGKNREEIRVMRAKLDGIEQRLERMDRRLDLIFDHLLSDGE